MKLMHSLHCTVHHSQDLIHLTEQVCADGNLIAEVTNKNTSSQKLMHNYRTEIDQKLVHREIIISPTWTLKQAKIYSTWQAEQFHLLKLYPALLNKWTCVTTNNSHQRMSLAIAASSIGNTWNLSKLTIKYMFPVVNRSSADSSATRISNLCRGICFRYTLIIMSQAWTGLSDAC